MRGTPAITITTRITALPVSMSNGGAHRERTSVAKPSRVSPHHRRTGGAVSNPLTNWVDHGPVLLDTLLQRSRHRIPTPVTASCRPDMRWAARQAAPLRQHGQRRAASPHHRQVSVKRIFISGGHDLQILDGARAIPAHHQPIAVMLDFVNPQWAGRRPGHLRRGRPRWG